MFKYHNIDEVIKKGGGRFRVTALIQKRLKGLAAGDKKTIEIPKDKKLSMFEIVFEEIMQNKIELELADEKEEEDEQQSK